MKVKLLVFVLSACIVFCAKINAAEEFNGITFTSVLKKGQDYKEKAEELAATLKTPAKEIKGNTATQTSAIRYGIAWKKEYERLKALQGGASNVSTPSSITSRDTSHEHLDSRAHNRADLFAPIATPFKEKQVKEMTKEQLEDVVLALSQQLEEVQAASVSTSSASKDSLSLNLGKRFEAVAEKDNELLNYAFRGDAEIIAAYKNAIEENNTNGLVDTIKTKIIDALNARINEIQPGNDESPLLITPGMLYNTTVATKGRFVRDIAEQIEALDLSNVALPTRTEKDAISGFYIEYLRTINNEVSRIIDGILPAGSKLDSIVLPNDVGRNVEKITNLTPRAKNAFIYALQDVIFRNHR